MNHEVYLGLGSNIEPRKHIALGLDEIAGAFQLKAVSSVYRSAAVGFAGAPFLNCVAAIVTDDHLSLLATRLRAIEFCYGRTKASSKFSPRHLDIDILTYDRLSGEHCGIRLPRDEITKNAFVLCPFAEIAGGLRMPGQPKTLYELWSGYDRVSQPLQRISFVWRQQALPIAGSNRRSAPELLAN